MQLELKVEYSDPVIIQGIKEILTGTLFILGTVTRLSWPTGWGVPFAVGWSATTNALDVCSC